MSDVTALLDKYAGSIVKVFNFLPAPYLYLSSLIIVLIGIFLCFKGSTAWDVMFILVGAYFGVIFSLYIARVFTSSSFPLYLVLVIGAVAGAILVRALVRVGLPLAMGFLVYLISASVYPHFVTDVVAGVVAFALSYILYKRITMVLSAVVGALMIWFALYSAGMDNTAAQIIASLTMVSGLVLQYMERYRKYSYERLSY